MPLLKLAIKDLLWSLLAASFPFVHVVFSAKCIQPPSRRAASVTARIKPCEREKRLAPGGRNRCTTQKPDFFSTPPAPVVIVVVLRQALQTGLAHHVNDTRTLLQGRAAAEDSYIHPAACLTEGRVVGGGGGVVSSPVCRFVALSPRVKWLLFLREHFF